jgi:Thioesterase-like superfamily
VNLPPFPAPTADLRALSTVHTKEPGQCQVVLPESWKQGRGVFGGLVLATLTRALSQAVDSERTLRSLTASLCGPAQPGLGDISVQVLRAGNNVSTLSAQLTQNGEVQAHAVGIFGAARTHDRDHVSLSAPLIPRWKDVEAVEVAPPFGPEFGQFFEFRPVGLLPFSGGTAAEAAGFVVPKNLGPSWDVEAVVACADAFWPSTFALESGPRPMATIAFTFELCIDPNCLAPDAPLFHRARAAAVDSGYVIEFRELWSTAGQLVALNQQTLCIIR